MSASPSSSFACRELAPFGVEIDLDPGRELTPDEQRAFRDLVYGHHLVVVRGGRFDMDAQARLMSYLGPVLPAEVDSRYVALDGAFADQAMAFHSDFAFTEKPIDVISLHALDVVDGETSTVFASGARAYQNLPPDLRARADSLRQVAAMRPKPSDVPIEEMLPGGLPKVTRDVVMKHPVTGVPILYVTEQSSDSIEGLPPAESDALLAEFASHVFAPANLYEHRWHAGDLVIWDNLALQHGRRDLAGVKRRTLQRVCVASRSFYDLCPQFFVQDARLLKWLAEGDPNVGRWARLR
jgi:taurine dioxygenase